MVGSRSPAAPKAFKFDETCAEHIVIRAQGMNSKVVQSPNRNITSRYSSQMFGTYYDSLPARLGDLETEVDTLREFDILADRERRGRRTRHEHFVAGGSGDESTVRANREAYGMPRLRPSTSERGIVLSLAKSRCFSLGYVVSGICAR